MFGGKKIKLRVWLSRIRPERLAFFMVIGAIGLVVGSFAAWQIITLVSPQLNNSCSNNNPPNCPTTVILRVSDYSEANCPNGSTRIQLPNSLNDRTVPCYADNALTATNLSSNGDNINLFRLEGQARYK